MGLPFGLLMGIRDFQIYQNHAINVLDKERGRLFKWWQFPETGIFNRQYFLILALAIGLELLLIYLFK